MYRHLLPYQSREWYFENKPYDDTNYFDRRELVPIYGVASASFYDHGLIHRNFSRYPGNDELAKMDIRKLVEMSALPEKNYEPVWFNSDPYGPVCTSCRQCAA